MATENSTLGAANAAPLSLPTRRIWAGRQTGNPASGALQCAATSRAAVHRPAQLFDPAFAIAIA
jgi:hypothetical protein